MIWIKNSNGKYICSSCGTLQEKQTKYCSNCGQQKDGFTVRARGEDCEYMHEQKICYEDYAALLPECWAQKNPQKVKYSDHCSLFKYKIKDC